VKRKPASLSIKELNRHRALLAALSDDLALPLLQVKTSLEINVNNNFDKNIVIDQSRSMSLNIESGLQLIEAYRLVLSSQDNIENSLETVSIGGVLNDVAHQLTPYAKQYNTDLEVDVQSKLTPVIAHPASLFAAIQCLSASMLRAQAAQSQQKRYQLVLGAHRRVDNIVTTGVFCSARGLSDLTLRAARQLVGKARQPLPEVPSGAAGGVLIADMLCSAMWRPLRAAAHRNMNGLATGVPFTKQLQIV